MARCVAQADSAEARGEATGAARRNTQAKASEPRAKRKQSAGPACGAHDCANAGGGDVCRNASARL